jgi:hypothetical protein
MQTEKLQPSKKKKKKHDKSTSDKEGGITRDSLNLVVGDTDMIKRKKENIAGEDFELDGHKDRNEVRKSKKKKRKREIENEESEALAKSETGVYQNGECGSAKKKKKHASESFTNTEEKDKECDRLSENGVKSKSKKQKKAKKEGTLSGGNSTVEIVDVERDTKRGKDKTENSGLSGDVRDGENSGNPEKRKKKKKHKKSSEEDMKQNLTSEDGGPLTDSPSCHKMKKKKKNKGGDKDAAGETSSKRPKDDKTREDTKGAVPQGSDPTYSGQWTTASLGDEQRQNKFLRLLGGFKAAKSGNSPLLTLEKKSGNVAMTQNQEGVYMRNMEDQYSKAMSFNKSRGLGLGFEKPPSEGKKFYIDKNVSKSKKFDD